MKKLLITGLLALLCWSSLTLYGRAEIGDIRLESRVGRLESQISRIQSQLTQLSSRITGTEQAIPSSSVPISPFPDDPTPEEQFDNLATLAIELKLQVRELEERVSQLEATSGESS
ncbi:MAG: hypothetical protein AAGE59_32855 [Cyanobacteria bacterium P01_F01_bin.86]